MIWPLYLTNIVTFVPAVIILTLTVKFQFQKKRMLSGAETEKKQVIKQHI